MQGYFHNIIRSRIPEVYIFKNKNVNFDPFSFGHLTVIF